MMGDKLYDEKGKMVMTYIEEIDAEGVVLKQTFNSEVIGSGKFPSGMNLGSGVIRIKAEGKAHGKWRGILTTKDGEMVTWKGSGHSMRASNTVRGIMVITFMTMSEKLKWMNSIIVVDEITGNLMDFTGLAHEWK